MIGRTVLLTLAIALPAHAQQRDRASAPSINQYLAQMDRDGNGRVSLSEYQDWLSYAFDALDRDRDGVLSAAEQPGARGKPLSRVVHRERLAERFRKQDANRDGSLSARELAAPPQS